MRSFAMRRFWALDMAFLEGAQPLLLLLPPQPRQPRQPLLPLLPLLRRRRDVIDWEYYKERLGNAIQKIITIPAAMQSIKNPVPRVPHPEWLAKQVRERNDPRQQVKITAMLAAAPKAPTTPAAEPRIKAPKGGMDLEDFGSAMGPARNVLRQAAKDDRDANGSPVPPRTPDRTPGGANRGQPVTPGSDIVPEMAVEAAVSKEEDYGAWLRRQKRIWETELKEASVSEHLALSESLFQRCGVRELLGIAHPTPPAAGRDAAASLCPAEGCQAAESRGDRCWGGTAGHRGRGGARGGGDLLQAAPGDSVVSLPRRRLAHASRRGESPLQRTCICRSDS